MVLCSLLLSPRDVLDLCQIKLRSEAFYTPAHQILFNLVAELVDSNKPIDFITLKQALKDRAQLDEIGGPEYLSDLFSFVPSAANADYYIDIIREKYLLRQMIVTCNRVVSDCYDHREEVDALLDRVEQQIFSLIATDEGRWNIDRARSAKRSLLRFAYRRINTHIPAVPMRVPSQQWTEIH